MSFDLNPNEFAGRVNKNLARRGRLGHRSLHGVADRLEMFNQKHNEEISYVKLLEERRRNGSASETVSGSGMSFGGGRASMGEDSGEEIYSLEGREEEHARREVLARASRTAPSGTSNMWCV